MPNSINNLHDYSINPKTREIFLFGEDSYISTRSDNDVEEPGVEYTMANRFIKNLIYLQSQSDDPITIHMKTCGGMWAEGMAIYDAVKTCSSHVKIINYTHARSMSSLIFLAADERVMHKHSVFMLHMGTMAMAGTIKQYLTEGIQLDIATEQMLDIYVEAMQQKGVMQDRTEKQIKKWLVSEMNKREDVYFSSEQAVEYGFADSIIEY